MEKKTSGVTLFLIIILILLSTISSAQEPLRPIKTDIPPNLDGVLNDEVWKVAPTVEGFKTFAPDYGKDLSQRTKVYMAYDSENLYFAFRCFDEEPDKIKASITSRDNIRDDDWICLNLDSFNDQQALYALYVNPYGIQMDSRYSNNNEDASFDLVWYSAGKIDNEGYVVEFSVPLKSIRYSDQNPVSMALFFERKVARTSEQGSYPEFDPAQGFAIMTQLKEIVYDDLEHYTLLELLPAFTYSRDYEEDNGNLSKTIDKGEFSLTGKYGITSKLILDGTYNPDFSQIEADAGQVDVNLRYDLFFPETRPFFLEGSENYKLGAAPVSEVDPLRTVIHTRTIVNPLVGAKLTGKLSNNLTIAALYSADELQERSITNYDNKFAHFGIARLKWALGNDGYLGAVYTSREMKKSYNRVIGIDGMFRLSESSTFEYNGLLSFSKDTTVVNPKGKNTFALTYKRETRDIDYNVSLRNISNNFKVETGYVRRTGLTTVSGLIKPKIYPDSKIFRRLDFEGFTAQTKDQIFNLWETFNHISLNCILPGNLQAKVKYSYSTEIYSNERFNTGGFHFFGGGWFTNNFHFSLLYRRVGSVYYSESPYQGNSNRFTAGLIFLPTDKLETTLDFIFYDFYRESDNKLIYEYPITRFRLTYQLNQYLFIRGLAEYNRYWNSLLTDFLVSFTYIPGTVFHLGYGSFYEKLKWEEPDYIASDKFLETKRGFFLKVSYLWRK